MGASREPVTQKSPGSMETTKSLSTTPVRLPFHPLMSLQRAAGNHAVGTLLRSRSLQAKFKIGLPGDAFEQEADRVADQVMAMPQPQLQRQENEEEEEELLQPALNSRVQRQEASTEPLEASSDLASSISSLAGSGHPLPPASRSFFESRFGQDFSQVRIQHHQKADALAEDLNARAFTVGQNIFFREDQYRPETSQGKHLLAHELTHVIQQSGSDPASVVQRLMHNVDIGNTRNEHAILFLPAQLPEVSGRKATATGKRLQKTDDRNDPERFRSIHQRLFTEPPAGRALQPWDAAASRTIITQGRNFVSQEIARVPETELRPTPSSPQRMAREETRVESEAATADQAIHQCFPYIPARSRLSVNEIATAVRLITPQLTQNADYVRTWLANWLADRTDIRHYALDRSYERINETGSDFRQLLDTLRTDQTVLRRVADLDAGPIRVDSYNTENAIQILAGRQAAFTITPQASAPRQRQVYVHPDDTPAARSATLVHEMTHMYAHSGYIAWVEKTSDPNLFGEGFTEYLARLAMTRQQKSTRSGMYQQRWSAINSRVASLVSDEDIARAYFLGEVWRLESTSEISRRLFAQQVGLEEGAPRRREVAQSRTSTGIVSTVTTGRHYRFMNLGVDRAEPKPEHVQAFREIYARHIANHPATRIRFVGHASSPGEERDNLGLSQRRSQAFYRLARQAGVPVERLIDADNAPHEGETRPTATEAEGSAVHARAFNRRVELFLVEGEE